ncbi:ABC transporter permease [Paenibacillus hemerocallicola]|uniref:ABC transporter permease n=2 Tax=Paenibacillus hemerocallicola TaxID=1172614 RepID=A0A5C4T473_9BACL|nr:ABC transporter permease [Paenibacillus hemerocallicola]
MLPESATEEDRRILAQALGLDQPLHIQFMKFLGDVAHGDFGNSFRYGQPAMPLVLERLPASLELAVASIFVSIIIAIPLGIISAIKRDTYLDMFISGLSVLGKSMPSFWLGMILILLVSVQFGLLPVSGRGSWEHLILPAVTLGASLAAQKTKLIRSNMLEVLNQDYIRTARSKGLRETVVIFKHAFRNTLIPVVTLMALQIPQLIGGALIIETVFAWPGMGQLTITAINARDMAVVQAAVFFVSGLIIVSNLLTDVLYRYLDPRIKYS